jgi:hypothetical protein
MRKDGVIRFLLLHINMCLRNLKNNKTINDFLMCCELKTSYCVNSIERLHWKLFATVPWEAAQRPDAAGAEVHHVRGVQGSPQECKRGLRVADLCSHQGGRRGLSCNFSLISTV